MTLESRTYPEGENGVLSLGDRHFVWRQADGTWLWWHDCMAQEHVSWMWFGVAHDRSRSTGHVILEIDGIARDGLTVQGSLICELCGDHGFIESGQWRKA